MTNLGDFFLFAELWLVEPYCYEIWNLILKHREKTTLLRGIQRTTRLTVRRSAETSILFEPKCTKIWSLKVPDLSHFLGSILTSLNSLSLSLSDDMTILPCRLERCNNFSICHSDNYITISSRILLPNGTNPGLFQIRFQCIWRPRQTYHPWMWDKSLVACVDQTGMFGLATIRPHWP